MTKKFGLSLVAAVVAITAAVAVPVVMAQHGPPQGPPMGRGFGGPPPGGHMGPGGPGGPGALGMHRGPGGPGGPMGMLGPGLRELDLTDAQREQMRTIVESHRDGFTQVGEKMRAARQGMGALIDADTLDEAAIRAKSVEVAAAEADAAILNAKVRAEVFALLTPEQQQKAKELRAARQNRRQQVAERLKQRRPH